MPSQRIRLRAASAYMLQFRLDTDQRPPTILLVGAHCDDIEIGCGGAVQRLLSSYPTARVVWITLSSDVQRGAETRAAAAQLLKGAMDPITTLVAALY